MYHGNGYTQHCPEGDDVGSRFRAGLGMPKRKLILVPDDLSHLCWNRTITSDEITIEQYNQFLSDCIWHHHSVGGRLYLDEWLKGQH
jgi:hypothetical protein